MTVIAVADIDANTTELAVAGQSVTVLVPAGLFQLNHDTTIVLTQYTNSTLFATTDTSKLVVSEVTSLDITGVPHNTLLNGNISLYFYFAVNLSLTYQCSYWSFENNSWLQDGCFWNRAASDAHHIECLCQHLTNFAVLTDVGGGEASISAANALALELITYIGCGVSIAGMVITIFTFLLFPVSGIGFKMTYLMHCRTAPALAVQDCAGASVLDADWGPADLPRCHRQDVADAWMSHHSAAARVLPAGGVHGVMCGCGWVG